MAVSASKDATAQSLTFQEANKHSLFRNTRSDFAFQPPYFTWVILHHQPPSRIRLSPPQFAHLRTLKRP